MVYLKEKCIKKRRVDNTPQSGESSVKQTDNPSTSLSLPPNNGYPAAVSYQNGNSKKRSKKRRDSGSSNGYGDDSDGNDNNGRPRDSVYNSDDDDSDVEQHNDLYEMTKDRKSVFNFMNEAKQNEFLSVRSCTAKKIDSIMELRPFSNWMDLIHKIQNHKSLQPELLNGCQDFLSRRNNMSKIMKKCTKMVQRLESAVAVGGGLTAQPSNLNSEFKLADYQLIGLNWLAVMHKEKMNGM